MLKRLFDILAPNSSRIYLARFAQRAAASIPSGSTVLDAGAGESPYQSFFSHVRYEATDIRQIDKSTNRLSFLSDLNHIPVRGDHYDLIFCSQTLEHVPEPLNVLGEFHRVMVPGGRLWLSAPFFFAEHEIPIDYFRYTQFGLTHLLQRAGFTVESIDWLEGYFGTLAYQLRVAAKELPLHPQAYRPGLLRLPTIIVVALLKIFFAALIPFFTWLDINSRYVNSGQCKNYTVIAVK